MISLRNIDFNITEKMKKLIISLIIVQYTLITFGQKVTDGNNHFALDLLQYIANDSANTFCSPYSLSTALFMTAAGAKSESEQEMLDVLCLSENTPSFHKQFAEQISLIEKKRNIKLNIANSIWMQKGFDIQKSYVDILAKAYKSKLYESDFATNADLEAKRINKWVEEKTKDKIKNLIKPGVLLPITKMVLVNAIYFYGEWDTEFIKEKTKEATFYLANGATTKNDFMHAEYIMKYAADKDFEVLSVPYRKNEASMIIFLPKSKEKFSDYLKLLDFEKYTTLIAQMKEDKVNITLPKFTITAEFELKEVLSEMGMPLPFSSKADFSGITGKKNLAIDKVIHKAFVDVSEKGTEAAASTAVVLKEIGSAMPNKEKNIYFKADHPFIFMINDNATGQILFVGVLNQPEK